MKKPKTFKIITFGCRTNQAESRMMGEEIIKKVGKVAQVDKSRKADVVIINTCCVTGKAEKEVRQAIRKIRRENPGCFLVVVGCWVEKMLRSPTQKFFSSNRTRIKSVGQLSFRRDAFYAKKENFWKAPRIFSLVDLFVGNKDKKKIPQLITKKFNITYQRPVGKNSKIYSFEDKYSGSKKALVKIQDGCDNFCTFCIVPYLRGRSASRPADKIVEEIRRLVKQGIEEVVLTGIDIASYKFQALNTPPDFGMTKSLRAGKSQINPKSEARNSKQYSNVAMEQCGNGKNDLVRLIRLILAETEIEKVSFGSMGIDVFDEEFIKLYVKNGCSDSLRSTRQKFFSSNRARIKPIGQYSHRRDAFYAKKENFCWSPREPSSRLTTHFHIPIQSGCNATLKRMGREYTIENINPSINSGLTSSSLSGGSTELTVEVLGVEDLSGVEGVKYQISNIKKRIPEATFSTDIIVGFPGETEEEFKKSLRGLRSLRSLMGENFTKIHVFRYSSREETAAARLEDKWGKVDERTKKKRALQVAKIISCFSTS